jgi:hypothetical protein
LAYRPNDRYPLPGLVNMLVEDRERDLALLATTAMFGRN